MEAGKRGLAGDTARAATSGEVKDLRRQAQELKTVVAEQALELRLMSRNMIGKSESVVPRSPSSLSNTSGRLFTAGNSHLCFSGSFRGCRAPVRGNTVLLDDRH